MAGPVPPQRPQAPEERLASKRRVGAEGDRTRHVEPGAYAGVQHHLGAPAHRRRDCRQHVDGRRQALDLAPAVVRDDYAVDPERHALFGIRGVEDAFHHQRPFPALAILRDLVPGKGAAHLPADERRDLVHVGVVLGVGLEIAETRLAMPEQRGEIARRGEDAGKHAEVGSEGRRDARRDLARARRPHRHVEGEHQHVDAAGFGALDQIETDRMRVTGTAIKLEPEHVGRDLGGALDCQAADETERIRQIRALAGGRQQLVRPRKHQRRTPHRRDPDRRRIAFAEQLDIDRRQLGGDAIARHQLDRIERIPIALDAAVGARSAVAVLEGEARQLAPRLPT